MVNTLLVEKLGPIKKCDIKLGQETILLGKNNTGKTYISYLIYGMYKRIERRKEKFIKEYLKKLINERTSLTIRVNKKEINMYLIDRIVDDLNTHLTQDLSTIFNVNQDDFNETKITVFPSDFHDLLHTSLTKVDESIEKVTLRGLNTTIIVNVKSEKEYWELTLEKMDFLFENHQEIEEEEIDTSFLKIATMFFLRRIFAMPNILYIPAERNGINVFRKELSITRSTKSFDINLDSLPTEKYPLPISDYMKYLNQIDLDFAEKYLNAESRFDIWNRFSSDILKGKYEYDSEQNEYYYRELFSTSKNKTKYKAKKIPLQISSSSIKSLFGLEYYFKFLFSKGDILFIDEPEMNLDPENQVKFAKFLFDLTTFGVKIIISSHSDYLIRSTTNEILNAKVHNEQIECKVMGYYFDGHEVQTIGDLSEVEYVEIFDDMNVKLEERYFILTNMLNESVQNKEGFTNGNH